jgi:quinol monooxygenase YgiN
MTAPIVYIDRSEIHAGAVDELREAAAELVAFVEEREPRLLAYGFHIDEAALTAFVVAVHPDAASLELHLRIGGPAFRKLGAFIRLRAIEVYGEPGDDVLRLLHEKAQMLGGASVAVHPRTVGFART